MGFRMKCIPALKINPNHIVLHGNARTVHVPKTPPKPTLKPGTCVGPGKKPFNRDSTGIQPGFNRNSMGKPKEIKGKPIFLDSVITSRPEIIQLGFNIRKTKGIQRKTNYSGQCHHQPARNHSTGIQPGFNRDSTAQVVAMHVPFGNRNARAWDMHWEL